MKKNLSFLMTLALFCNAINAQNLVINPSFETYSSCPSASGDIGLATGWSNSGLTAPQWATVDYLNVCANASNPQVGVPSNNYGYQYPASGNAYAGILCYGTFSPTYYANMREFCMGTLSQPLTVGVKYYVNFKVTRRNQSSHAVNNIGARFLVTGNEYLPFSNSAQIRDTSVISDTLNWSIIKGSFIADSNYTVIVIGNHFNDSITTAIALQPVVPEGHNAYYFIDDICVSTDSMTCNAPTELKNDLESEKITLFPNPFKNEIRVSTGTNENSQIVLYDLCSRKIMEMSFLNSIDLNTEQIAEGIYIYEIRTKNQILKKGKLIKQ